MARKKKTDKDKEISLEEAQNIIKRLAHPKHINQEEKLLKEAAAVVLRETQPGFEFGDDEDSSVEIDTASVDKATSELTKPPGFFEQMGSQVSNLGAAGVLALASAAYFQVDTVVEETRTVAAVAEEKWEEVKFEHPNINWDDPLAGFTTILGVGEIDIDLEPPKPKESQTTTSLSPESNEEVEETETEVEESETESNEEVEETKEKPKKKKGLFGLFGGDDEEESEEEAEEKESEPETEEVKKETKAEKESSEPEPEAEEQVEEKPKKKSGGLLSFFTGGNDESDEQGEEPIDDEPSQTETTEETEIEQETKTSDADTETQTVENKSGDDVKKSSGGGLFSRLFGNDNIEEVVEDSEVSNDEEPTIMVADSDIEEAPPLSIDEEQEIEIAPIDEIDDIKPHSDVEIAEVGEINLIEIVEVADVAIEEIEVVVNVEEVIQIDDVVEETVAEVVIEKVVTPIDTGNGEVNVVSPAGPAGDLIWADIFGPNAPGRLSDSESDATPI